MIGGSAIVVLASLVGTSCAPSDLEPIPGEDSGTADAGDASSTMDATETTDEDVDDNDVTQMDVFEPNAQFEEVATILTENCAQNGCHGDQPNGNFHLEGGPSANAAAVRSALEDTETTGGDPLIAAGSQDDSAVYVRITADVGKMPPAPNEPLTENQISTISQWIEDGANFE